MATISSNPSPSQFSAPNSPGSSSEIVKKIKKFFCFEESRTDAVFEKILPTKYSGWRSGDETDIRGVVRKKLEEARQRFDIAIDTDFNNNISKTAEGKKTKNALLSSSSEAYYAYHIIKEVLQNENLLARFLNVINLSQGKKDEINKSKEIISKNLRMAQNIRAEFHSDIAKEYELNEKMKSFDTLCNSSNNENEKKIYEKEILSLQEKYIEICRIKVDNDKKYNSLISEININFQSVIKNIKLGIASNKSLRNIKCDEDLKNCINTIASLPFDIIINEDVFNFICVKEAIENDVEFKSRIVTFIYQIMYDSGSCDDLIASMGLPGKAFIACLSTRSWFFNTIHSRWHLPNSAFVFFKMLGLKKEDLKIIAKKDKELNELGNTKPVLNLTYSGSYLYQDIDSLRVHDEQKQNLQISTFGITKQEYGDKKGFIDSVWKEIEGRWDKFSINEYLINKNVFEKNKNLLAPDRQKFANAIKSIEKSNYKQDVMFPDVIFNKRIEKTIKCIENLITFYSLPHNMKPQHTLDLENLKLKFNRLLSKSKDSKEIDIHKQSTLENKFLNLAKLSLRDLSGNNSNPSSPILQEEINLILNHIELSQYYRNYDDKQNQMVKMAFSLLKPNGIIRKIFQQTKDKIEHTQTSIQEEFLSLKENKDLSFIKRICANHQSLIALVCCHNEFLAMENSQTNGEQINQDVVEIFSRKISSVFLSNSLGTIKYLQDINQDFTKIISEIISQKKYSEFTKLLQIKVRFKNMEENPDKIYSFEELSKLSSRRQFSDLIPLKFLDELLSKDTEYYEIIFDKNEGYNQLMELVKNSLTELNKLYSQDILNTVSNLLSFNQHYSILKVVNAIINKFGLSGVAANDLRNLFLKIEKAHNLPDSKEKTELLAKLNKECNEDEILNAIFDKMDKLNKINPFTQFNETELESDLGNFGVGGRVKLSCVFTGKTSTSKLTRKTERGGLFYHIFGLILQHLADGQNNDSVKEQLENESDLSRKITEISGVFFEALITFGDYVNKNLNLLKKSAVNFSNASATFDTIILTLNNDLSGESPEQNMSFFKNLDALGQFSTQIDDVSSQIKEVKKEIEEKLKMISLGLSNDLKTHETHEVLQTLYCKDSNAENFENAFIGSCQIQRKDEKENAFTLSDYICQAFIDPFTKMLNKEQATDHEIIPMHDVHPYRLILGEEFKSFLQTFFKFRFGIYNGHERQGDFERVLKCWEDLHNTIHNSSFVFAGYYFKGTKFEKEITCDLESKISEEKNLDDQSMELILLKIDCIKAFIEENISYFNRTELNTRNQNQANELLKTIQNKFLELRSDVSRITDGNDLTRAQFLIIKDKLEFIGNIRKFNTTFFQTGHEFLKKLTSSSKQTQVLGAPLRFSNKETEYEEHLRIVKDQLLALRGEIYNIELRGTPINNDLSILEHGNNLFIGNQNFNPRDITQWKRAFSSYKTQWEKISKYYFDLNSKNLKEFIVNKFNHESEIFKKIEIELLSAESLISIYNNDKKIGPKLFKELVLFNYLQRSDLFKTFEKIRDFLQRKEGCKNGDIFTKEEITELTSLAESLQDNINKFANTHLKIISSDNFLSRALGQFAEWFWGSNSSDKRPVVLGSKTSAELKNKVASLLDYLVKAVFEEKVTNLTFLAANVASIEKASTEFEKLIFALSEYERNQKFLLKLEDLHLKSIDMKYINKIKRYSDHINYLISQDFSKQIDLLDKLNKYNSVVFTLKSMLLDNSIISNILFIQITTKSGHQYYDFVDNVSERVVSMEEEIKIRICESFSYPVVLNYLYLNGEKPTDIAIKLKLKNPALLYRIHDETQNIEYKLDKFEEEIGKDYLKIQTVGDKLVLFSNDNLEVDIISFENSVKLWHDANRKFNEIKSIFSDISEDIVLQNSFNYERLSSALSDFVLYYDNSSGSIKYNFLDNNFFFYKVNKDNYNHRLFMNHITASQSTIINIFSRDTNKLETVGFWEKPTLSLGNIYNSCVYALKIAKKDDKDIEFPLINNVKFCKSSLVILSILRSFLNRFAQSHKQGILNLDEIKLLKSFSKTYILLNNNASGGEISAETTIEVAKHMSWLIQHFNEKLRKIKFCDDYKITFNGEEPDISFKFRDKKYSFSNFGLTQFILEVSEVESVSRDTIDKEIFLSLETRPKILEISMGS